MSTSPNEPPPLYGCSKSIPWPKVELAVGVPNETEAAMAEAAPAAAATLASTAAARIRRATRGLISRSSAACPGQAGIADQSLAVRDCTQQLRRRQGVSGSVVDRDHGRLVDTSAWARSKACWTAVGSAAASAWLTAASKIARTPTSVVVRLASSQQKPRKSFAPG